MITTQQKQNTALILMASCTLWKKHTLFYTNTDDHFYQGFWLKHRKSWKFHVKKTLVVMVCFYYVELTHFLFI